MFQLSSRIATVANDCHTSEKVNKTKQNKSHSPVIFYAHFLLYARTSKKHSDSSRLAKLVVNLAIFVRGGSDHKTKPKTCMQRHLRMSKKPMFSSCPWTSEVMSGVLPPDN